MDTLLMRNRPRLLGISLLIGSLLALYTAHNLWENRYNKWEFEASPDALVCQDGTLLTDRSGSLFALDGITGHSRWTYRFPTRQEYPSNGAPFAASGDNNVYLMSEVDRKPYKLYALDLVTGKERWSTQEEAAIPVNGENHLIFLGNRRLVALDSRTGHRQWAFEPPMPAGSPIPDPDLDNDGHIRAVASANGTVWVAFGRPLQRLFALDAATGIPQWSAPLTQEESRYIPPTLLVTGNNLVVLGENGGNISAFDGDTGQIVWKFEMEGNGGSPWLCQESGVLYATTGFGTVYALVSATGTVKWKQNLDAQVSAQPVLDRRGTLYLGTRHNTLLALSTQTGECVWRHYFGWSMTSIPDGDYITPAIGPKGMVYAASTDHYLYALQRP